MTTVPLFAQRLSPVLRTAAPLARLAHCWGRGVRRQWLLAKRRARVHHIYYALAVFDVAAVAAGLMLSHHLMAALTDTIERSLAWRQLHENVAYVRNVTGRLNAPGNDVFESRDPAHEVGKLASALERYASAMDDLKAQAAKLVPAPVRPLSERTLQIADAAVAGMTTRTRTVLDRFAAGDLEGASAAMAAMDRSYGWALDEIDNASRTLRSIEADIGRVRLEGAARLGRLEVFIGAMILVMVLGVTHLGHRISRTLQTHTARLARMRDSLEARVADRTRALTAANASIARLNTDLQRSVEDLNAAKVELSRQREELQLQNTHLEATLNNTMRGLCLFDGGARLVMANTRYYEMYGFTPQQVPAGMSMRDLIHFRTARGDFAGQDPDAYYHERIAAVAQRRIAIRTLELPDNRIIEVSIYPTADGGWVSMHDDVTDERKTQQRIVHLAHHDTLTGLTNRLRFHEEMGNMLKRTERGESFAVLCLDLDHFKQVNDTLGHPIGDKLLKEVAERLRSHVRKGDVVARIGGDEFAIVQWGAGQPQAATALAARLIEKLSQPFVIDDHQIVVGTSVGIVIAPGDGQTPDALLKNADLTLYRAKTEGRGTFRLFEVEMDARMQERRRLELDLRQALALDQFELFYQPLIDARTLTINGFEALLRWRHPERGLVPPLAFIPVAEEMGLMGAIGAWVLKQGCMDAMRWPREARVAINVSPAQFRSRPLEFDVMAALATSGLSPDRLELEITESVLLESKAATIELLTRLRALGIRIAMDDFGTGYSSLSYLLSFPFDKIKLDRSFTMSLGTSNGAQSIVQAVVGLGKGLGMSTTAEGVETREQLDRLRAEGCSEVQGFLFSKPVPAHEIPALLRRLDNPTAAATA